MGSFQVKDRVAVGDNKYIITTAEDGKQVLVPSPDEVVEEGTPLNREVLQPLFDTQYNSVFFFNISDDNIATAAGQKTIAEFFAAIIQGNNVTAYGERTAGFVMLRPIASVFRTVILEETFALGSSIVRLWSLTESSMSFMGETRLATEYAGDLDENDDLNEIKTNGVYSYRTASIPKNCPFKNAGIVIVEGSLEDNDQKIQTVTRYGAPGESAFRGLAGGAFSAWAYTATIQKGEITATTSQSGNCSLGLDLDEFVILSVHCVTGNTPRICIPYRGVSEKKWAVKVLNIADMTAIANSEVTVTYFFAKQSS